MSKKTASIILILLDILSLWVLWVGGKDFQRILAEIHNHVEVIDYLNRVSFYIMGVGLPIIHILTIVEHFRPALTHKHSQMMNLGVVILVVGLISGSIGGAFYLSHRLETAGYIYCRKASGISALAKSVVYTINDQICEEVATKQPRRF